MRSFYRAGRYGMENSIGYLVRRTVNMVLPQLEALFADEELTFSQWTVLMALRERSPSTAAELARHICHDAGSLTRLLDELEARRLIRRVRSATDRRCVGLTLLPKGRVVVEGVLPRVVDHWNGLLAGFSRAEARQLVDSLTRLIVAAESARALRERPRRPRGHMRRSLAGSGPARGERRE